MLVHRNDVFIHLASLNANLTCDSDRLLELNIAKKAMKFCKQNKVRSLVFFSTSQVYGSASLNDKPFKEAFVTVIKISKPIPPSWLSTLVIMEDSIGKSFTR